MFQAMRFKRHPLALAVLAVIHYAPMAQAVSPDIVISQVYGGGGNSGATLKNDFIELFNRGNTAVSLNGWSVQYASSTGTTWQKTNLTNVTLQPGQYYLIQQAVGAGGTVNLPTPDATGTIAMSSTAGKVALVSNQTTLSGSCPTVVDFVGYGTANCFEASAAPSLTNTTADSRALGGCTDTDNNSTDFAAGAPAPRNAATLPAPCSGVTPPPPPPVSLISEVQGNGASSPVVGTAVTVEAIVVGDFQGTNQLDGFFVQEEVADYDANPASSEGLFVSSALAVNPGDKVRVTGTVTEANNLTTLSATSIAVLSSGNPLPAITPVAMPFDGSATDRERYEGMLVTLPQLLTVTENFQLGRFGQIVVSANGRLRHPTHVALPGAPANAAAAANDLNRLFVDDASNVQNPDPVIFPAPGLSAANTLRSGDTLTGATGVMSYGFGAFRLLPTAEPVFVADNPRPAAPPALPGIGSLRVASFNVLNYFNGDGTGGGFPTSRGAENLIEFARQKDKIVQAIHGLNADVIGLMEIENDDGSNPAIRDLVDGLNVYAGSVQYAFIDTGIVGTDQIRVALIYKLAKVAPSGLFAVLNSSVDPNFIDTKNRPALAQTFLDKKSNKKLTVVVNHLKSKGSDCIDVGDPDMGDEQGNCNQTRSKAAQALANWLATDPTGSGNTDAIIIGDLNSYAKEDPIRNLELGGYTNLVEAFLGQDAYSYVFDGEAGYLDHALSSLTLTYQVKGVAEWHINADEPITLDYNTNFKTAGQVASFYSADPYRSSDHDPVVVEVLVPGDLDKDGDVDTADQTRFRSTLGKCTGNAGYLSEANYDGVGCVTYADYQRWYSHYTAYRAKVGA